MQILGPLVCARSAHFGLEQLVSYCFVPRHRTQNQGEAPSLCTQELPKPGQDWTQGKRIKCSTIYSIVRGVNAIYSARKRPSKLEMMWQTRKDEARKWHVNLMPEWYTIRSRYTENKFGVASFKGTLSSTFIGSLQ